MKVSGLAAIVTGGGSGLGAATVTEMCRQGMQVAALDVNEEGLEHISAETGALGIKCDVSDADSATSALAQAREAHGVGRLLVNCAGIAPPQRIVAREGASPLEDFKRVIDINLVGTYNMMRLFAEALIPAETLDEDDERGVIINTASVAAFAGICELRYSHHGYCTGFDGDTNAVGFARGGATQSGGAGTVSEASGPSCRVCLAGG